MPEELHQNGLTKELLVKAYHEISVGHCEVLECIKTCVDRELHVAISLATKTAVGKFYLAIDNI